MTSTASIEMLGYIINFNSNKLYIFTKQKGYDIQRTEQRLLG